MAVAFEGEDGVDESALLAGDLGAAGEGEDAIPNLTGSAAFEFRGAIEFDPRAERGILTN